jgi:hypothetical protein
MFSILESMSLFKISIGLGSCKLCSFDNLKSSEFSVFALSIDWLMHILLNLSVLLLGSED